MTKEQAEIELLKYVKHNGKNYKHNYSSKLFHIHETEIHENINTKDCSVMFGCLPIPPNYIGDSILVPIEVKFFLSEFQESNETS